MDLEVGEKTSAWWPSIGPRFPPANNYIMIRIPSASSATRQALPLCANGPVCTPTLPGNRNPFYASDFLPRSRSPLCRQSPFPASPGSSGAWLSTALPESDVLDLLAADAQGITKPPLEYIACCLWLVFSPRLQRQHLFVWHWNMTSTDRPWPWPFFHAASPLHVNASCR